MEVVFGSVFAQFTALGQTGEISRAFSFFAQLQTELEEFLSEPIVVPVNWEEEVPRYKLGAYQVSNSLLVTLTAGFFNSLKAIDLDQLRIRISAQDWTDRRAPYGLDLPFGLLGELEQLRDGLVFEVNSEGRVVSPSWYIVELVFRSFASFLQGTVDFTMVKGISFIENKVERLSGAKRFVEATVLASDALEMEAKARLFLHITKSLAENLEKERSIEGLMWPDWKWNQYDRELDSFHNKLIIAQVSHLGALFSEENSANDPDYFGKVVIFAGEECLKSLDSNNANLFGRLFEKYFDGIVLTYEKLRSRGNALRPEQFALLLSEPIMDLMDISGYAWLYSEYHQNPSLWEPCRAVWEKMVKEAGTQFLKTLAALAKFKKHSFGFTSRDQSRTRWSMVFGDRMRSLARKYRHMGIMSRGRSEVDHQSKLIRIIGGSDDFAVSRYQPDEIFVDLFLSRMPEAQGLDFGLRHKVSDLISEEEIE